MFVSTYQTHHASGAENGAQRAEKSHEQRGEESEKMSGARSRRSQSGKRTESGAHGHSSLFFTVQSAVFSSLVQ